MINISPLQPIHINELIQLSRSLENDSIPCSYWGLDAKTANLLLQNPNKLSFVAILDKSILGIGTLTRGEFYQRHLAEISIAVDVRHRKNGVARSILTHLENVAQEQKIELLKALITTTNTPSRRLFESLNYEHRATLYAEFKSQEFGEIDDCVYYKRLIIN